jgi:hypothetical protein
MKRALTLSSFFLLITVCLQAADVSGVWKGAFDYNGNSVPVTFNLKASGADLSGTVDGLPTPSAKIQEGKVDGDAVSFWINIDYEGQTIKLVYKGKVAGDQIQFNFGTEDGSWGTELTAKRST